MDLDETLSWPFFDDGHRRFARGARTLGRRHAPRAAATTTSMRRAGRRVKALGGRRLPQGRGAGGVWRAASAARRAHALPGPRDPRRSATGSPISPSPCRASAPARSRCSARRSCRRAICRRCATGKRDRRLRAVRAGGGLRRRRAGDDRDARRAVRMCASTARRPGSPTAASPTTTSCSRAPAKAPAPRGCRRSSSTPTPPGLQVAERIEVIAPHPLATPALRRRARAARQSPRQAGRRVQGRDGDARHLPLDRGRRRARLRPPRACTRPSHTPRRRRLFGAPLGDLQMTQAAIADSASEVDASALLVYRAAWTKDQGAARVTREAAMAKMVATEAAQRVIDRAVQLHGGLGDHQGRQGRGALSRDPGAAHLRGRDRGAEDRDRARTVEEPPAAAGRRGGINLLRENAWGAA